MAPRRTGESSAGKFAEIDALLGRKITPAMRSIRLTVIHVDGDHPG